MNIQSDIRYEAAARKRGAPIGPRIRPVITYDDEGMLTTYTGKVCNVCAVQLTSRNRYEVKALCIEHGREEQRNRVRGPRRSSISKRGSTAPAEPVDPKKERLLGLFRSFLAHPDIDFVRERLIEAMNDHELIARLRRIIPPTAAPAAEPGLIGTIPIEDPGEELINPDHRSTHSEFLADCSTYGV